MRARTGSLILWNCHHKFTYQPRPCPRSRTSSSFSNYEVQSRLLGNRWLLLFLFHFRSVIFPYSSMYLCPDYSFRSILGWIMEPMDIIGKSKEDASLPKGSPLTFLSFNSLYNHIEFFGIGCYCKGEFWRLQKRKINCPQ